MQHGLGNRRQFGDDHARAVDLFQLSDMGLQRAVIGMGGGPGILAGPPEIVDAGFKPLHEVGQCRQLVGAVVALVDFVQPLGGDRLARLDPVMDLAHHGAVIARQIAMRGAERLCGNFQPMGGQKAFDIGQLPPAPRKAAVAGHLRLTRARIIQGRIVTVQPQPPEQAG